MFDSKTIMKTVWMCLFALSICFGIDSTNAKSNHNGEKTTMQWIQPSEDGNHFVETESGKKFIVWGCNYDHDESGRLLEEYWQDEWPKVAEDFEEMKALGANLARVHLQVNAFMNGPKSPNPSALQQLKRLIQLAEDTGLYLDLTGLGCYHKEDVPEWYDTMDEEKRWDVQAMFWQSIAEVCANSPAVFCYDLMNEPILPGKGKPENEWLAGEFGGKHFVQRITLDLNSRSRKQVAKAWVDRMVAAIRKHDKRHMVTVGVIPWHFAFYPNAKNPLFYSKEVSENLDFASVHFYPESGEVETALKALQVYDVGKPLLIEEMFPLRCGIDEMDEFIDGSKKIADGWVSFYWGKTAEELAAMEEKNISTAIKMKWLKYFQSKALELVENN